MRVPPLSENTKAHIENHILETLAVMGSEPIKALRNTDPLLFTDIIEMMVRVYFDGHYNWPDYMKVGYSDVQEITQYIVNACRK